MKDQLLSVCDESAILVTAVFLENGDVLLSGDTGLQSYELDLVVNENITCDQFLGAIYGGLRDTLISRYHLNLKDRIADLAYRKEGRNPSEMHKAQVEARKLRPDLKQGLRLRTSAMMYDAQARKLAAMEEKYRFHGQQPAREQDVLEKIGWIASWQVFHECYRSYINGYPAAERRVIPGKSKRAVIARCSAGLCHGKEAYTNSQLAKPLIWLNRAAHGDRKLRELGFHSGSRLVFDPVLMRGSPATVEGALWIPKEYEKEKLIDPASWVHNHRQSDITIDPPAAPVIGQTRDLIPMVLSPLITTGAVMSAWFASGADLRPESVWLTGGTMVAATVAVSLINGFARKSGRKNAIRCQYEEYEEYIRRVIETIRQHQNHVTGFLRYRHPPVWAKGGEDNLINRIANSDVNAFSFRRGDQDFLWVRMGATVPGSQLVPSGIRIQGNIAEGDFFAAKYVNLKNTKEKPFRILVGRVDEREDWGYLKNLPEDLAREFEYMEDAPVGLSLLEHTAVSLLMDDPNHEFHPILHNVLLELCCHHRPEDLQVVWFFEETTDWKEQHRKIQLVKNLPHMRQLFADRSQFVFTKTDALQAMERLGRLCGNKEKGASHRPHVLAIFEHHYGLEDHPVFETLTRDNGITCWYCCRKAEEVPDRCTAVIEQELDGRWFLLPGFGESYGELKVGFQNCFEPDLLHGISDSYAFQTAFTRLTLLYEKQKRKKLSLETLDLFRLLMDDCISRGEKAPKLHADLLDREQQIKMIRSELKQYIRQRRERIITGKIPLSTLAVPIGLSRNGVVSVDIHEKADGPHLLIVDESGVDKNVLLTTYFLNLCTHYGPDVLQTVVLSGCGTAGIQQLDELPHVTLLNADGGGQAEPRNCRLRTFLELLCTEMDDRKQKLEDVRVSTVDEYNCALRNRASSQRGNIRLFGGETVLSSENKQLQTIPHRVIVLDDYPVLRGLAGHANQEEPFDLDSTIAELIRLSNGLGIHFVITTNESEQQLSKALNGSISAKLQLTGYPSVYNASSRCVVGLFSGNSCIRRQILIADGGEDLVSRPCAPFRVTLAAIQGLYRTFFDTEDYCPSSYALSLREDSEKHSEHLSQRNPNTDPRPESWARKAGGEDASNAQSQYRGKEHPNLRNPNADPRPESWARKAGGEDASNAQSQYGGKEHPNLRNPNADPKPEDWTRKTRGGHSGSNVRAKYKAADSIFYPAQSMGIQQKELLIELLKQCDTISHS